MRRKIIWGIAIIVLLALVSSGWVFNILRDRETAADRELATLQESFGKQYGTDGITITQLVSPDKVYAASWTSKDGTTHVSWNIGGIWVTVFNGKAPESATPETVTP
jgi:hypothetical protein